MLSFTQMRNRYNYENMKTTHVNSLGTNRAHVGIKWLGTERRIRKHAKTRNSPNLWHHPSPLAGLDEGLTRVNLSSKPQKGELKVRNEK